MALVPVGQFDTIINVNGTEKLNTTQSDDQTYNVAVETNVSTVPDNRSVSNKYEGPDVYTIVDFSLDWGSVSEMSVSGDIYASTENNIDRNYDYEVIFGGEVIASASGTVADGDGSSVGSRSFSDTKTNPSNKTFVLDSSDGENFADYNLNATLDVTYVPNSSVNVTGVSQS